MSQPLKKVQTFFDNKGLIIQSLSRIKISKSRQSDLVTYNLSKYL